MDPIKLSKPLFTHKGSVTSITLAEPTAGLFVKYGEPFKLRVVDGRLEADYDNKAIMGFLCGMSEIDNILLEALSTSDFRKLRDAAALLILGQTGLEENPTKPSGE